MAQPSHHPRTPANSRLFISFPASRPVPLQSIRDREVCVYSISCKKQHNIDITLEWLTRHAKN